MEIGIHQPCCLTSFEGMILHEGLYFRARDFSLGILWSARPKPDTASGPAELPYVGTEIIYLFIRISGENNIRMAGHYPALITK